MSKKAFCKTKFIVGRVRNGQRYVTFQFPKSIANKVVLGEQVYCAVTNGVLQISVIKPTLEIPVLGLGSNSFTSQGI
jgi:hypothetical protein